MYYLENYKRLSDSILWDMQRKFFLKHGIESWNNKVPFYVTSNPYIAYSYAEVVAGQILDLNSQDKLNKSPLYILELGAGSGKFAFLFLRALESILSVYGLENTNYCYIMSDFDTFSFEYWADNPYLQDRIDQGKLDFAVFDLEFSDSLTLHYANKPLVVADSPLIVVANYVFDSVRHDCLVIENGNLYEQELRPYTETQMSMEELIPNMRNNIKLDFARKLLDKQKINFTDHVLQQVVQDYCNEFSNLTLLVPIVGIDAINKLNKIANGALLVIASDKADTKLVNGNNSAPHIAFHGSFSLQVNFDFIGRYIRHMGGNCWHQTSPHGLKTMVFACGYEAKSIPNTLYATKKMLTYCGPNDYFVLYQHAKATIAQSNLEQIIGMLKLSHYDPTFFAFAESRIIELIKTGNLSRHKEMLDCFDHVANNFYYMPSLTDVFFSLAIISFHLKHYDAAIKYYQMSIHYFRANYSKLYNLIICHLALNEYDIALELVDNAFDFTEDGESEYSELLELQEHIKSRM